MNAFLYIRAPPYYIEVFSFALARLDIINTQEPVFFFLVSPNFTKIGEANRTGCEFVRLCHLVC